MLKKRILTVLLLVPPLLAALYYLPPAGVALLLGLFIVAGAWEWATLTALRGMARAVYVASIAASGLALLYFIFSPYVLVAVLIIAIVWWLWAPIELHRSAGGVYHSQIGRLIVGAIVLLPAWIAGSLLHAADPQRPALLLYVIALVACADTGAYAAGHMFGRTKLAPAISPGKTLEGVAGGLIVVLLFAYLCGIMFWDFSGMMLAIWMMLAMVTALISVVGDLVESKLKRIVGAKDSGTLLPGHGGVLDRIDALTAALPVFVLGWLLWFGGQ